MLDADEVDSSSMQTNSSGSTAKAEASVAFGQENGDYDSIRRNSWLRTSLRKSPR